MQGASFLHRPVLRDETVDFLLRGEGGTIVDGTVGLGGHAEAILSADSAVRVIGIDRDEQALASAAERLSRFGGRIMLVHGDYRDLAEHLDRLGVGKMGGLLLDLGVSSLQLDRPERGFSFRTDGPLDMRMDPSRGPTAAEWIAAAPEEEIVDVLRRYGEERYAERIARAIGRARQDEPIETTGALAGIVHAAVPRRSFAQRIDPATRTFQAIRIVVNDELGALQDGLAVGFERLTTGGILVVISFHSLEDRLVKRFFRERAALCTCPPDLPVCVCGKRVEAEILTPKPIEATAKEIQRNPRARSAKLRAARKVV